MFSHIFLHRKGVLCCFTKGQLEQVQLLAPSVVVKNKAVNLTTVLQPSNVGTVTYYWWFDNKTEVSLAFLFSTMLLISWIQITVRFPFSACQPVVTLDRAISFTFSKGGSHSVTVQASVGNTVHQDQMRVAVYGEPIFIYLYFTHWNRLVTL